MEFRRVLFRYDVTELVRSRLGRTPPVRVTAAANDTVLLRSRGATPGEATEATKTYAASYVEVQRRRVEAATASAAEQVRGKVDQVESQIASAEEPERSSLRGLLAHLTRNWTGSDRTCTGPGWSTSLPPNRLITGPVAHGSRLRSAQVWPSAPPYPLPSGHATSAPRAGASQPQ
jgi:hypothetical protein